MPELRSGNFDIRSQRWALDMQRVRALQVMTGLEAERYILGLLSRERHMTTMDIEKAASSMGRRCPDQTVLFLTKMKGKGLIKGEVSQEKRGWLWSLP